MQPLRTLLFVPGHRASWVDKAISAGVDGIILDLEDSVPTSLKAEGRAEVARTVTRLRDEGSTVSVFVRPNPLDTGLTGDDIESVVIPGLSGLALPMLTGRDDVVRYESLVTRYELKNGVEPGSIEFICDLETAESYAACEEIAKASPRVATLFAGTARDADVSRSIGFTFSPTGEETLYLRSRAVLACRANGLNHPLVGIWQDLNDDEGAKQFSLSNRALGFKGQVLIHPAHAKIANEVFTPSKAEVDFYRRMIDAFEISENAGAAAVSFEGMHVDYAHVKTAREIVRYAQNFDQL
ncbi:CoA ester lyase [Rhodococcus opacus]|uniref:HpcH/HpaI aldolase/citrate lyase family protein n=1 Tax=Rhodococcus opacus TaxID=37919 RepID=UPI00146E459E|nr:CoA ester lyase [Rhodococcus opacus]MDV7090804.1 CoA ester lyase [Rhodococcus opacus]WKN60203.1 CoA ester lyase [Rhodococcus opacus]